MPGPPVVLQSVPSTDSAGDARASFFSHAARLARLQHPTVVRLHGVCTVDGTNWLVFEKGVRSLSEHVSSRGPGGVPVAEFLCLLTDVGRALAYLHALTPPVVHLAVDMAAVSVFEHPFVPDRFLAKLDEGHAASDVSVFAPVIGDAVSNLSPKLDVYAFGILAAVLALECLSVPGAPPPRPVPRLLLASLDGAQCVAAAAIAKCRALCPQVATLIARATTVTMLDRPTSSQALAVVSDDVFAAAERHMKELCAMPAIHSSSTRGVCCC